MLLDEIVDAVEYSRSAKARVANFSGAADEVFAQFLSLCQSAGPERCALAEGGQTPAKRVAQLFEQLKGAPLPALGLTPPLLSPRTLSYSDLLLSQFQPMRDPSVWPRNAADLAAALQGDASALTRLCWRLPHAHWVGNGRHLGGDPVRGRAGRRSPQAAPQVLEHLEQVGSLQGLTHFWWEWARAPSGQSRAGTTIGGPGTPRPRTRSC